MVSASEVALATSASIALVCLAAFVFAVLYLYYQHSKYSHIPGPKRTSFFLGNVGELQKYYANDKTMEDAVKDWGDQFGPVMVCWFLHNCVIYFFDVQAAKEILVSECLMYPKGWTYDGLNTIYGARFLGHGLICEKNHDLWLKRRVIFDPAFNRSYLKTCISQFNASSDLLVGSLQTMADGKTACCLLEELNKATIDIIAKVAFGTDFHQFDPDKIFPFREDFIIASEGLMAQYMQPWNKYNPMKAQRDYRRKVRKAISNLREMGRAIIKEKMSALSRGEELGNNILSFILRAAQHSPSEGLNMEEMLDEFTTFFLAGNETTANLLASAMLYLCQNPEVMYRLKTEVDAVISDKESIPYEDLSKLEYTLAVLKEALRLRPPGAAVLRVSTTDTVVTGVKIPANSTLCVPIYAVGQSEIYWENPMEFIPDRFLHGDESSSGAFMPFSIGPRNCIGQQFALIEARVLLAKLVQNFNFSLVPGQSLAYVVELTLKPKDGCQVFITPTGEGNINMPTAPTTQ